MILGKEVQGLPNLEIFLQYAFYGIGNCLSSVCAKSIPHAFDVELLLVGHCVSLAVAIMQQLLSFPSYPQNN